MPQAVGIFLAYVGQAIVTGLIAVGFSLSAAVFVLNVGVQLAGLALLGAISKKLTQIPDIGQTAKSNLVTVRGTLEHQRIIYGEVLVSGPLWYMNTAGSNNQSLYHAVVVAGHECEDITDVWLDSEVVPDASIDWSGNGSVDSGWLAGDTSLATTAYFDKFLGSSVQSASPDLMSAFTEINSKHQGRGLTWFLTRLDFFKGQTDVFSRGAPQNYKALVKGKLVYNPNSDSSQAWGTGPHRVNSSPTWEYSNNPALCWADYMIDGDLGFGESSARINYAYVASVAAICSGSISTPNSDTTQRFNCNGTLSTGTSHRGNLESILSSANMTMALIQGVWKLRGWEYETPALAFGDDDLRKDIQISLSTEEEARYNSVRAQFIDADREYQAHQSPVVTASEYIARDNGETLFNDIQLPMTSDIYMAQRLATGILEQSDLQKTVIYPSNFKTLPVEIGGTIMLSNTKMGWDQDTFRITNYKLNDMKGIDLVLQEDNSAAYADVGTSEYTISSGGSYVTANPGVPAPTSFYITNVANGALLNWTNPAARLYDYIQVWRSVTNSFGAASAMQIGRSRLNSFLDQPPQNNLYYYWLRAENFIGEVSSPTPDVNSGGIGVYGDDGSYVINHDPQFEQTPHNTLGDLAQTFWTPMNTIGMQGGLGEAYVQVASEATGTGDSNVLQWGWTTENASRGLLVANVRNTKVAPVLHGAGIAVNARYRVTSYSDINSTYLDLELVGQKSLHNTGGNDLVSFRITIPNSIGWTTFSDYLDVSGWSSVESVGYVYHQLQNWIYQAYTPTNTPRFFLELDYVTLRWRNP